MSGVSFTANHAASIDFWRELCPQLTIEGRPAAPSVQLPPAETLAALISSEGYVNQPDVFAPSDLSPLRDCVLRLQAHGIPTGFAFVYDQFWNVCDGLAPYLTAVLGADYRILPAFWAWCVEPSDTAAGWKAHRDRPNSLDANGRPQSLTVWLPLTDATPLNGCIYLLPAHLDPDIVGRRFDGKAAERFTVENLQNIRALPATAGSLLSWHQEILHWGSRASRRGRQARCSLAHEFQRGDRPTFAGPLFRPGAIPPFSIRVGWIAKLFGNYAKHQNVGTPAVRVLAAALERKFPVR